MEKIIWELGVQEQQDREASSPVPVSLTALITAAQLWCCHQHRPMVTCLTTQGQIAKPPGLQEKHAGGFISAGAHELCCPMQMFPANYFQLLLVHPWTPDFMLKLNIKKTSM